MAGKNYVEIAHEATFATAPASGYRGVEAADDGHSVNVLTSQRSGIRRGQQGPLSLGAQTTVRGGAGTIKTELLSNGLGFLLRAVFGDPVITTPVGATAARKHVYATSDLASAFTLSTIIGRELQGGAVDHEVYTGGQVTEFKLAQGLGPDGGGSTSDTNAKLEFALDYAKIDRVKTANGSTTYPTPLIAFGLGEATLSLGPDLENLENDCLDKFEFVYPTGLDLSTRCISASLAREKAYRGSLPAPTLGLGRKYDNRDLYDAFLDGDFMAFRAEWVGPVAIEDTTFPSVTLDVPSIRFTGSTPQMSQENSTTQDLPAEVLWNGTDPMVTLTLITTDTAV